MADDIHSILGIRDDATRVPPPRLSKLNLLTVAVLIVGAVVTLRALSQCFQYQDASGVALWALAPSAVFLASCGLSRTRGRALATLIVSGLATAFAAMDYRQDAFGPRDPNEGRGLDFYFLPPFVLLVALILLAVMFFTRARKPSTPP